MQFVWQLISSFNFIVSYESYSPCTGYNITGNHVVISQVSDIVHGLIRFHIRCVSSPLTYMQYECFQSDKCSWDVRGIPSN